MTGAAQAGGRTDGQPNLAVTGSVHWPGGETQTGIRVGSISATALRVGQRGPGRAFAEPWPAACRARRGQAPGRLRRWSRSTMTALRRRGTRKSRCALVPSERVGRRACAGAHDAAHLPSAVAGTACGGGRAAVGSTPSRQRRRAGFISKHTFDYS